MTATTLVYPDADRAAVSWVKSLQIVMGGKAFFRKPRGENLPREFVLVQTVDGGLVDSDIRGQSMPEIQFEAWAKDQKRAAEIAWAICAAAVNLESGQLLADGVATNGADVTLAPLWRPEEKAEFARYICSVRFRLWQTAAIA